MRVVPPSATRTCREAAVLTVAKEIATLGLCASVGRFKEMYAQHGTYLTINVVCVIHGQKGGHSCK